jgi:heme/copper-type cytochrome/quinol oxidase subunit 4
MSNDRPVIRERDIYVPLLGKIASVVEVLIMVAIASLYKLYAEANHVEAVVLLVAAGISIAVALSYLLSQPSHLASESSATTNVLAFVSNLLLLIPLVLAAYMVFYKGCFSLLHLFVSFSVGALLRSTVWLVLGILLIKNIERSTQIVRVFSEMRKSTIPRG